MAGDRRRKNAAVLGRSEEWLDFLRQQFPEGSILLKRGESWYFQTGWNRNKPENNRRLADHLNRQRGISKAQEKAMSFGSLFGWDKPGADPRTYEQNPQMMGGMEL